MPEEPYDVHRDHGRHRAMVAAEALLREHRQDPTWESWHEAWGERVVALLRQRAEGDVPEHLLLAGRFHFPLSSGMTQAQPWTDRIVDRLRGVSPDSSAPSRANGPYTAPVHVKISLRQQRSVLERCGYTFAEAHRIVQPMDGRYGLRGDPDRRLLERLAAQALLAEDVGVVRDARWGRWMWRLWDSLSPELAADASAIDPRLRALPMPEPPRITGYTSTVLGTAVDADHVYYAPHGLTTYGIEGWVGFYNVRLPFFDHGVDMKLRAAKASPQAFDAAMNAWMHLGTAARQAVATAIRGCRERLLGSSLEPSIAESDILRRLVDINDALFLPHFERWRGPALFIPCTWVGGSDRHVILTMNTHGEVDTPRVY